MDTHETNGLFIFRRDLRLIDNVGLYRASKMCDRLYTCFIFTPEQVTNENKYKSNNSVLYMIDSLKELENDINKQGGELITLFGKQEEVVNQLIHKLNLRGVFFNKDYSPYALDRDNKIKQVCEKEDIVCNSYSDYYLFEPGSILSEGSGEAYKKYTPFYNRVVNMTVSSVKNTKITNMVTTKNMKLSNLMPLNIAYKKFTYDNPNILVRGGRKNGVFVLKSALVSQSRYKDTRDFFHKKTSHMSAYIKFGCISIREVYHSFAKKYGNNNQLIAELIWRDFFAHILYAFPDVVGQSYQPKYRNLKWKNDKKHIELWKQGNTGFPLVDAAMRQMNETGYMHNRGRLITSNFLNRILGLDWRHGEKYFAQTLVDYDPCVNNGNWQWIASVGVDTKPSKQRIFNPALQSMKYDREAQYIKHWIPELKFVSAKDIHNWSESHTKYINIQYEVPIVDYKRQRDKSIELYKKYE